MTIAFEHKIEVACAPEVAFALLDDLPRTSEWLAPCVSIEKLDPGPNKVGTRLLYKYREGGRGRAMNGEIKARTPNARLTCVYADKMMLVEVDFRVERAAQGAQLTHAIDITPQTFFGRLMTPLIRRALPKQTKDAMENVKRLLEARS
jgi:hypothetical protein